MTGMAKIAEALLKTGANPNMQNSKGRLVAGLSGFKLNVWDALCLQFDHRSICLCFVVYQNSTARSCSVRKRASVQPVATVQTVSLTPLCVNNGQLTFIYLDVNKSVSNHFVLHIKCPWCYLKAPVNPGCYLSTTSDLTSSLRTMRAARLSGWPCSISPCLQMPL